MKYKACVLLFALIPGLSIANDPDPENILAECKARLSGMLKKQNKVFSALSIDFGTNIPSSCLQEAISHYKKSIYHDPSYFDSKIKDMDFRGKVTTSTPFDDLAGSKISDAYSSPLAIDRFIVTEGSNVQGGISDVDAVRGYKVLTGK